ncbi:MAG: hypothetical protein K5773_03740 [Pseudobutyrivibrio sp.]|nr:hypothetical protein [Pseudobutyrivibrio sp.]
MSKEQIKKIIRLILQAFYLPLWKAAIAFAVCGIGLVYTLINGDKIPVFLEYIAYILSFYTLSVLVWAFVKEAIPWGYKICIQLPIIKDLILNIRYRQRFFLYTAGMMNFLFLIFYFVVAFYYKSKWFYVIGLYNLCSALVRGYLSRQEHLLQFMPENEYRNIIESKITMHSSLMLFVMNIVITIMAYLVIFNDDTFKYHFIILYGLALYVFVRLTVIIIAMAQTKPHNTGIWKIVQLFNLATALVSLFTFQTALLHTYEDNILVREQYNAYTGVLIFGINLGIVIWLLVRSRKIRLYGKEEKNN